MTAREKDILVRLLEFKGKIRGREKIPYTVKHFILFYFILLIILI